MRWRMLIGESGHGRSVAEAGVVLGCGIQIEAGSVLLLREALR